MVAVGCYVLGLESNFRGDALIHELERLGIDVQIHYGINATQSRDYLANCVDQAASLLLQDREMGMSEVACALGHLSIWRKIANGEPNWTFVFEDDAVVLEDISILLSSLTEIHEPTIVQLNRSISLDRTIYRKDRIEIKDSTVEGQTVFLVKKLNFSSGGYGYLMNKQAAKVAVESSRGRKVINIADWPYLWRHKVSFWEPTIDFVKHEGESIIDVDRWVLLNDLHLRTPDNYSVRDRLKLIAPNLLGIRAWKFHRLGYPAHLLYFNSVIIPLMRRLLIAKGKLTRK
jgi:GR25 family glycosyltransferase involved in LPS biosynthesis